MEAYYTFQGRKMSAGDLKKAYLDSIPDSYASAGDFRKWAEKLTASGKLTQVFHYTKDDWIRENTDGIQASAIKCADKRFGITGKKKKAERKRIHKTQEFTDFVEKEKETLLAAFLEHADEEWDKKKGQLSELKKKESFGNYFRDSSLFLEHNYRVGAGYLDSLGIGEYIKNGIDGLASELQDKFDRWLAGSNVGYKYFTYDYDGYYRHPYPVQKFIPLDADSFEDFLEFVENSGEDEFLSLMENGHDCIYDIILDRIADRFPEIPGRDLFDILIDDYDNEIHDAASEIFEKTDRSREHVLSCISDNPHYRDVPTRAGELKRKKEEEQRKQKEREEELKASILTAMPGTYPGLYPLARKIKRHFTLHIGPANSGKTYSAMQSLREAGEGIYLAPLRLLASEQYGQLNADGFPCSLVTGEEREIVEGARIQSSTVEMMDPSAEYPVAVVDEAQMVSDRDRGWAWTAAILGLRCREIHVCAAPGAEKRIAGMVKECEDDYKIIRHERQTPLSSDSRPFSFPEDVKKHDALIVFSKRNVHAVAYELGKLGVPCSIIYGNLPYDVRQAEAQKFASGKTDVLVSTDAIGMGLNLPIRRIVFLEIAKFDGVSRRTLLPEEAQQIAGRAGRMGIFPEGVYSCGGRLRDITELVETGVPDVEYAVAGFPESLIHLDGRISEIISQWEKLPGQPGYRRMNTDTLKRLVLELEQKTDNKQLVYDFATIPFNPDGEEKEVWDAMVNRELEGKRLALKDVENICPLTSPGMTLNELEHAHRVCDMLYSYGTRFGHPEDISDILQAKKDISGRILSELSSHGLKPRRCRCCGGEMPWNYPYGMCQTCHDTGYGCGGWC